MRRMRRRKTNRRLQNLLPRNRKGVIMKPSRVIIFMFFLTWAALSSGCIFCTNFEGVQGVIDGMTKDWGVKPVVKICMGPLSLNAMGAAALKAASEEEAADYLKHISGIQLGVYELGSELISEKSGMMSVIERELLADDWELFIRVKDKDEFVVIYFHAETETDAALYLAVLDGTDMVLGEIKGNLTALMQAALQNQELEIGAFA